MTPEVLTALMAAQAQRLPYAGAPAGMIVPPGIAAQIQVWQSQFPPPEAAERFERIHPGAFDRMIKMAEFAQKAQADDTKRAQDYAHADTRHAQTLGAVTTALAMICAVACVGIGTYTKIENVFWVAGLFLGVPLMAVANKLIESARSPSTKDLLKIASNQIKPSNKS
jgi:uncharacterized membrane protein